MTSTQLRTERLERWPEHDQILGLLAKRKKKSSRRENLHQLTCIPLISSEIIDRKTN